MANPQLGQPFPGAGTGVGAGVSGGTSPSEPSQILMSSTTTSPSTGSKCCEGGRPIMTDPHTGQTVCSCQYSSSLLSYSRVAGLPDSVYSSAYAAQGYMPFGADPSAFYSLNSAYGELKDTADAWRSALTQPLGYAYDPTTMTAYPYTNGYGGMDLSAAARRKNATRESTSTLKAWLYEHRKNPYPTKGEKIMLAIITKMTLTQVSTWFANARRRLKKENKMTWSPRNKPGEGGANSDDDDDDADGGDDNDNNNKENSADKEDSENNNEKNKMLEDDLLLGDTGNSLTGDRLPSLERPHNSFFDPVTDQDSRDSLPTLQLGNLGRPSPYTSPTSSSSSASSLASPGKALPRPTQPLSLPAGYKHLSANSGPIEHQNTSSTTNKPRIWSIADVATSTSSTSSGPQCPAAVVGPSPSPDPPTPSCSSSAFTMNHPRPFHSAYPVSMSHPGTLTHPYGLHPSSLAVSRPVSSPLTSHSSVGTPHLPRYGMGGGGGLGFPGGARDLHQPHMNGFNTLTGERPPSTGSTTGSTSSDCLENRTAFKPVTKNKLGEFVRV